jgi:hypothetical protein
LEILLAKAVEDLNSKEGSYIENMRGREMETNKVGIDKERVLT